jgi:hypothetical protein
VYEAQPLTSSAGAGERDGGGGGGGGGSGASAGARGSPATAAAAADADAAAADARAARLTALHAWLHAPGGSFAALGCEGSSSSGGGGRAFSSMPSPAAALSGSDDEAAPPAGPLHPAEWRARHEMVVQGEEPPDPFQEFGQTGFPPEVLSVVSQESPTWQGLS